MAQVPDNIVELIRKFISELELNEIHINRAILFGSYANGTFNDWSDIDLAIVSGSFKGNRVKDRDLIIKIKLAVSSSLEPIPFRPENFTTEDPFVKSIIDSGLNVFVLNKSFSTINHRRTQTKNFRHDTNINMLALKMTNVKKCSLAEATAFIVANVSHYKRPCQSEFVCG